MVSLVSGEWCAMNDLYPFEGHHLQLTTHHSPLTTHHSPLTTHHSPLSLHPLHRLNAQQTQTRLDRARSEIAEQQPALAEHRRLGLDDRAILVESAVAFGQVPQVRRDGIR